MTFFNVTQVTVMKSAVTELGMDVITMSEKDKCARMDGGDVLFTGLTYKSNLLVHCCAQNLDIAIQLNEQKC